MRVLFMGTPVFALPTLSAVASLHEIAAVVTRPDKRRGRGQQAAYSAVKEWADRAGLPIEQPTTLRDPKVQARLAGYGVDVVVVAAYGLILPKEILEMPPLGCVNVHASLLPRHRGAAPIAWSILKGDIQTGITTMLMDEGLDTGPMLLRRTLNLKPRDTTPEVTEKLASIGAEVLVETLGVLDSGNVNVEPQPEEGVTLAPSFKKEDGALDWNQPASSIDARVRALQPWPGTFTFRGDERLLLWRVEASTEGGSQNAQPGTVLMVGETVIRVACSAGHAVDVLELQRSGGRRQSTAEFLRGRLVAVGERWSQESA
jgi:methionyl-tRNA formyltransferase